MLELEKEKCEACNSFSLKVSEKDLRSFLCILSKWEKILENNIMKIQRVYTFKNYEASLVFTNKVAALAQKECHHPSILLEWGRVTVTYWTHAINALHKNDFICAAKTEKLFEQR